METLIAWVGFLGGWLLFAGPTLQAALELAEEAEARETVEAAMQHLPPPDPVSPWWWLVPPVRLIMQKRRSDAFQRAVVDQLSALDLERLLRYLDKARGWMYVGLGAAFIATKETWELTEHHEWPVWVFWVLTAGMVLLCLGGTVFEMVQADKMLSDKTGQPRRRHRDR